MNLWLARVGTGEFSMTSLIPPLFSNKTLNPGVLLVQKCCSKVTVGTISANPVLKSWKSQEHMAAIP
jgi:hypothetical protein